MLKFGIFTIWWKFEPGTARFQHRGSEHTEFSSNDRARHLPANRDFNAFEAARP
jgi:hypothetical protein